MKRALSLGKIAGINVQIHWTFILIILWAIYVGWSQGGTLNSVLWTIGFVLSVFVCVVLHELGHSLTARRYGIETRKITLLPIGGVASLARMPEDPKKELAVAVMGPAVNVVIAGILYVFVRDKLSVFQNPEEAQQFFETINANNFFTYLYMTNIILVVFNAIPAFPMDGGRVLRALLSFRFGRVRATQFAANLGQVIAVGFFFLGIVYNPILILISIFVFFGASGEYMMIRQMNLLRGHKVREAMMSDYTVLSPNDDLEKVGKVMLSGRENNFVVVENGSGAKGVLYKNNIVDAFQNNRTGLSVSDMMDDSYHALAPNEDLSEIFRSVQGHKQTFFPVMENGKLVGTIDMENINEFIMIQSTLDY